MQADVDKALSQRADDKLLSRMVSLVKAELMLRANRFDESVRRYETSCWRRR